MKIVVCISHVPDTTTKIVIGPDSKSIDKTSVTYIINPYDEFAIEEALRLKEKFGGETQVVCMGSDAVKETIRKSFAMGIEKGIFIKENGEMDSLSVANAIAEVIKPIAPDIILFGKQSIDYDNSQVGIIVAEKLGFSSVSVVTKLEINNDIAICEREIEGGKEIVEAKLPVVITAQKGLNEPRYPNLKGIMAAKTKPIQEVAPSSNQIFTEILTMKRPPSKSGGRILGADASTELVKLLHEEVKII